MIPVAWDEVEALDLGVLERGAGGPSITGIKADSRAVGPGDLFVALNTGVDYVADAAASGAATLVPRDQEAALAALASLVRSKSDARVVAVVGSTGKTSTKDILGALCSAATPTVWAAESQNNEIGLPLTVCRLEPDTAVLVTEMGMRGLGQIAELCEIARPDVAVVTSIGPEHLELVGTVERVAEANAEAIAALPAGGIAVVPADAPELAPFLSRSDIEIRRFDRHAVEGNGHEWTFAARRRRDQPHAPVHRPPHGREHSRRARCLRGARASARSRAGGRRRDRALPLARRGAAAAGRRLRRQRCVQRQSDLDACRPARPRRRARTAAGGWRSSERWRSSARRRRVYHERVGALLDELGIELVVAVGEGARPYLNGALSEARQWIPGADAFDAVAEHLEPRRRDPRQGVARSRPRRHPGVDRETG